MSHRKCIAVVGLLLAMLMAYPSSALALVCAGVDRSLSDADKEKLAPTVATQTAMDDVDVLESYRVDNWQILYIDAPEIDPAFLFYNADPLDKEYVTQWNGAVRMPTEQPVREWLKQHMPEMPDQLAACFAERIVAGSPS